ncbi:alcohol acetyltransferase [Lipomyces orientalis]|uniref:Alcohol acetyltransferase n=1 Tax=Lipomyces orientalis TaxID=1233043 RepID=A0ACC3TMD3_9ASCO
MTATEGVSEQGECDLGLTTESHYELVREGGHYETMHNLFHELGIQSNILVFATYSHCGTSTLTDSTLFKALRIVINHHPALGIIGVDKPSQKKTGNHRLWEARLNTINLKDCVEFVQYDGEGQGLQRVIEKSHNEWFSSEDKTRPWWKLVVVNSAHVLFVYHHMIGDGRSGYVFHRSLLAALNEIEALKTTDGISTDNGAFIVNVPATLPPAHPIALVQAQLSMLHAVYIFLWWTLIRLIFSNESFLFSDACFSNTYPTPLNPFPKDKRTVTRIESMQIDRTTKEKCVGACRIHNTTLTALLQTLIQVTLATDIYPKARLGFSRVAVDVRRYLKVKPGVDVMMNAASTFSSPQWLGRYREAGRDSKISAVNGAVPGVQLDIPLLWQLASENRAKLHNDVNKSKTALQDYLTIQLLGIDNEEFASQAFPNLGRISNNTFLVSNIGEFQAIKEELSAGWSIAHVEFSAAATKASCGTAGIVFNVASVEKGELVVNASYEEGVLRPETVRKVMIGVKERLKLLLE